MALSPRLSPAARTSPRKGSTRSPLLQRLHMGPSACKCTCEARLACRGGRMKAGSRYVAPGITAILLRVPSSAAPGGRPAAPLVPRLSQLTTGSAQMMGKQKDKGDSAGPGSQGGAPSAPRDGQAGGGQATVAQDGAGGPLGGPPRREVWEGPQRGFGRWGRGADADEVKGGGGSRGGGLSLDMSHVTDRPPETPALAWGPVQSCP